MFTFQLIAFFGILLSLIGFNVHAQIQYMTCDNSQWFFPQTCSPVGCVNVSNPPCVVAQNENMDIISSSVSAMTCNSNFQPANIALCKNTSLNALFAPFLSAGIVASYCTDKNLIIITNGMPNHPLNLFAVPHPPAGCQNFTSPCPTGSANSGTGGYTNFCVTRFNLMQFFIYKIPLYPADLGISSLSNNVAAFKLPNAPSMTPISYPSALTKGYNFYPVPGEGAVGIALNGIAFKVPFSQNGFISWEECSLDSNNGHVPQGDGYHYHGDPFCNNFTTSLYCVSNYTNGTSSHPPQIGFALDGFKIFGRYLSDKAPGANVPLDICGGHSHDNFGYHYHSQVKKINVTDSGQQIPQGVPIYTFLAGVNLCWRGNITVNPGIWNPTSGPNNLTQRIDFANFQPPCALTDFIVTKNTKFSFLKATSTTTPKNNGK